MKGKNCDLTDCRTRLHRQPIAVTLKESFLVEEKFSRAQVLNCRPTSLRSDCSTHSANQEDRRSQSEPELIDNATHCDT